jgi:hypothetical protein
MSDRSGKILRTLLPALIILDSLQGFSQVTGRGEDILDEVSKYRQADVIITYPGFNAMTLLANDFSVSSCDGKKVVISLSRLTDTLFINKNIPYTLIKPDASKSVYSASSVAEAMQWHSYPTYPQYDSIMHILAKTYPDRCVLDTIGYSIKGKAIYALKISDNASVDEDKPEVFLTSSIHGDELGGFVMMMRLAEELASKGSSDNIVAAINQGLEVWINPISNPDGAYTDGDVITSPVRFNSNDVDLNRNYPDPEITSATIQPENVEMIKFMQKHKFILSVNFHAGSEVVNYPWDRWRRLHPDDEWFYDISRRYADTVHLHSASDYMTYFDNGVTNGAAWYMISGGRQDYVTWSLQGREVTIELDYTKQTPASELETLWISNHRSFLRYIAEALYGVKGHVISSSTSLPVKAEVFIEVHDTDADSSQVYSDAITGSYNRLLAPGTWNLKFIADGYDPYVAENVSVTWDAVTSLNVALTPKTVKKIFIWPVPTSGDVNIFLPDQFDGNVRFTVTSLSGEVVMVFTDYYINGLPVKASLGNLAAGTYIIQARDLSDNSTATGRLAIVKTTNK